jgi:hypothetical protein
LRDVDQLIRSTVALRKLINEAYGFEYWENLLGFYFFD